MKLTTTQVENFRQIEQDLQTRRPVLLTGKSNGKTTLLHQALDVLAQKDEKTGGYTSSPKHAENAAIDFFPRVYFPTSSAQTVQHLMRQVLQFCGKETGHHTAKIVQNFDKLMSEIADAGNMLCLAIDNAELLGGKAWTILKVLNEYRDPKHRRNVGTGLLIAGDLTKLKKMPASFLLRCTEHAIGKLTDQDVIQLVESLHPGQFKFFSDNAIKRLAKCNTTLQIKSVVDRCVAERVRYRLIGIDEELVEEKLAA